MAAPIPTLGYRSRTDAVLALRAKGMTGQQIADAIGIKHSAVVALEISAIGRKPKAQADPPRRGVMFPATVLAALGPAAEARRISPNQLARRLVEAAVADGLVDAILDDRASPERNRR